MAAGWTVTLDGVTLSGGDRPGTGCLTLPPEGLGIPELRDNDVVYAQRDGVKHFSDWYEPRIITINAVVGGTSCRCPSCGDERVRVAQILKAWSRKCEDVELVITPPCDPHPIDRTYTGPYGIIGRPRRAGLTWRRGRRGIADLVLRFDATDHQIYLLDEDGEPGSGVVTVTATPDTESECAPIDGCMPMCFDVDGGSGGSEAVARVYGTECTYPIICFNGPLTSPILENLTTGETVGYDGIIANGSAPVCLDTSTGIATQGGAGRTHLITGNSRMTLSPGENILRLISYAAQDTGSVDITFRSVVISA